MKKLAYLLSGVFLLTVLAGCGGTEKGESANSDFSKHYTISIDVQNADKPLRKSLDYISEKFNVDFELIPITNSDWNEKVRIWMATGDAPDILWANIQNYNFSEYTTWADQGLLKELPDLKKYPNLYEKRSKLKSAEYFQRDGKDYAWLAPRLSISEKYVTPYQFMYRRDWAEELGLAHDDDTYTWDEFLKMGKRFSEEPLPNGSGKRIGLVGNIGVFPHFAGLMQISPYWEQYYLKDGKYVWGLDQPETTEGIKTAKKLYDDGVLWTDQITSKSTEGLNKFMSGQAGITFAQWSPSQIQTVMLQLEDLYPEMDVYKEVRPMYVKAPNGKLWGQTAVDYWSISVFNKSLSDDKLDRILRIYDWMISPDGLEIAKYGIEGEDFTIGEDGKYVRVNSDATNPLVSVVSVNEAFNYENVFVDERARNMSREIMEKLSGDDAELREYDYALYFFSAPNKDQYGLFYEEGKEKIKELIVTSNDIEADWEKWKDSVRDKVNLVLDELNTQLLK